MKIKNIRPFYSEKETPIQRLSKPILTIEKRLQLKQIRRKNEFNEI